MPAEKPALVKEKEKPAPAGRIQRETAAVFGRLLNFFILQQKDADEVFLKEGAAFPARRCCCLFCREPDRKCRFPFSDQPGKELVSALLAATFLPFGASNAIGISGVIALAAVFLAAKPGPQEPAVQGTRLMDSIGITGFLPQLLAALGAAFTSAGVGDVIAGAVSSVIPDGSRFIAVVVYCLGMALFTAIMGNGFAAFSVITVGIGIPFLIGQGGNPVVIGALGLTAGYCGTLMTPMAANFNIMPAALLEMKNSYGIIRAQAPVAVSMLIFHVVLMYFWTF